MLRRLIQFCVLFCAFAAPAPAFAQEGADLLEAPADPNRLTLRGGVVFELPALPEDPALLAEFQTLTAEEQRTFYERRAFLLQKLVGALSFPRSLGTVAWAKEKTSAGLRTVVRFFTPEAPGGTPLFEKPGEIPPQSLKGRGAAFLESVVASFLDKMWTDAAYVARASGVGFTFVGGPVVNTSLAKWGYFWGRALSIDIGHDFSRDKGYVRLYYDKQALERSGLSFDTGLMFDFLVHFRDLPDEENRMNITHQKLPMIGCYRYGDCYRGYGFQLGVHVFEMAALVVSAFGYPEIGVGMVAATRWLGAATIYSTSLERNRLSKKPLNNGRLRRLFGGKKDIGDVRDCERAAASASFRSNPGNAASD